MKFDLVYFSFCRMKWGVFLFFAGFVVLMVIFTIFLVPETKGLNIDRVQYIFAKHKIWRKVMGPAAVKEIKAREAAHVQTRNANEAADVAEQEKTKVTDEPQEQLNETTKEAS